MAGALVDNPTKQELMLPSIAFVCIATAAPLIVLVGGWTLFGLAVSCLHDETDIAEFDGACTLCVDCDLNGVPLNGEDAHQIGLFCRFPAPLQNATARVSGCNVGSTVLVVFTVPAIILASLLLVVAFLCALLSIVGACQAAGGARAEAHVEAHVEEDEARAVMKAKKKKKAMKMKWRCCAAAKAKVAAHAAAEAAAHAATAAPARAEGEH